MTIIVVSISPLFGPGKGQCPNLSKVYSLIFQCDVDDPTPTPRKHVILIFFTRVFTLHTDIYLFNRWTKTPILRFIISTFNFFSFEVEVENLPSVPSPKRGSHRHEDDHREPLPRNTVPTPTTLHDRRFMDIKIGFQTGDCRSVPTLTYGSNYPLELSNVTERST